MGSVEKRGLHDDDDNDKNVNKETRDGKYPCLSVLFMYADWLDYVLMFFGTLGAIGDGMSTNCILVFASHLMNSLGYGQFHLGDTSFMRDVQKCSLYFVFVGLAVLVAAFAEGYCWCKTSERQVVKIRYKYLESVLRQDVGLFDSQSKSEGTTTTTTTFEVINNLSKDSALIEEVLSEKVPLFLMHSSVFFSGIGFSAYFSWRLSLVAYPTLLLLVIPGFIYGNYLLHVSRESYKEYGKANVVLAQALSSIKTVYSLTAEKTILAKYASILDRTTKLGIKQGIAKGLAVGSNGVCFAIWAFLAWYGSLLVMRKGESGGRIYAAGISFILGGLSLGVALPELKHFTEASVAASRIFQMINRVPQIGDDGSNGGGIVLESMRGEIEFEGISFRYPSRPDSVVLKDFMLKVEAGKTVALVGQSGSGKSTAIALLQRFYDVGSGAVKIDGVDIRVLKLSWIRGKMGLVSQDHALFDTSIRDNIAFGKVDEASMEEVIAAASAANAHSFISQLPYGYETKIGEGGALLSGGQKQRIAIARALIRKPMILLLDEATSALDSESEKVVQNALEHASMGRTTLVVAHKLSTVGNADLIAVVSEGRVVETGVHEALLNKPNGYYAKLVKLPSVLIQHEANAAAHPSPSRMGGTTLGPISFSRFPQVPQHLNSASPKQSQPPPPPPSFRRLLSLTSPLDWKHGVMGSLSAAAFGAVQPIYALTIGGMISAFFIQDHNEMRAHIRAYSVTFCALCFFSLAFNLSQSYNFACMGERLTQRVRLRMLGSILSFEPAWFDDESGDHSSGTLCSRLGQDAAIVKSLVVDRLSLLVQTGSSIGIAVLMGLVVAWRLAVVVISVQPLTILCVYTRKVLLSTMSAKLGKAQHRSTQIAAEAVHNHKVVAAYGCSGRVMAMFDVAQEEPRRQARRKAWLVGAGIGSAQCLTFMCWALDFWYGGKLVEMGQISAGDVFKTFFILVSSGKVIAEAGSMTSDLAKGVAAVSSVFEIIDRRSLIPISCDEASSTHGEKLVIRGWIELRNVEFAYPSRGRARVLRGLSLEVRAGSSMGLVGRSGCGKSTVIGLIQRLYDVVEGGVLIDGMDIRDLDLLSYRSRLAVVSQDPIIFAGTVRDNILLGNPNATEDEMVEAAKVANAHEFISGLKEGYNTECGERGVQLSGGQKQRIAIARAVIRNPIILLLDEATSALDVESERMVQQALHRIMVGRTTVVVAHRLNTIKDLDCISLIDSGIVVQSGTYSQLSDKNGAFFNFANLQHN